MTQRWHVRRGTDVHGPFTTQECIEFRAEGRLQDHDEVRQENATTWIKAGTVQLFQSQVDTMRTTPPPLPFVPQQVAYVRPLLPITVVTAFVSIGVVLATLLDVISRSWLLVAIEDGSRAAVRQAEMYGGVHIMVVLSTGLFFLSWMHRGYSNLEALGQRRKHGLGWAQGAWFVPLYNLYKPGAIGIDLERQSAEACSRPAKAVWAAWWWGLYLGQFLLNIVVKFVAARPARASDLDLLQGLTWMLIMVAVALCIATLGFIFSVVGKQSAAMARMQLQP